MLARSFYRCVTSDTLRTIYAGRRINTARKQKFLARLIGNRGQCIEGRAGCEDLSQYGYIFIKSKDADFSKAWDNIEEAVTDAMEQELYRRAVKGVQEPVFYKGDIDCEDPQVL
jgi:hypothetical protein